MLVLLWLYLDHHLVWGSAVMITDSLFRISEKCSTHLFSWVSSVVRGFPSLSLTRLALACVCLQSCLYITVSCCCCLPTPMTLASGGSPMFPLAVHQPASPSIWPAVQSPRRGLSTNPGATMWCVCGCS